MRFARWASVSKMPLSLAFAVERDWNYNVLISPVGPPGSTLANLLVRTAVGWDSKRAIRWSEVGTQRIYSNYGIDLAVSSILREHADNWLQQVFRASA